MDQYNKTKTSPKNPKFITRYGEHLEVAAFTGDKTATKQSFKDECDINNIMKKFNKTGQLPDMIKKDPQFGDFSQAAAFQEAQHTVIHAVEQFQALPSRVRERFHNDPERFLSWVHSEASEKEMRDMGLLVERNPGAPEPQKESPKKAKIRHQEPKPSEEEKNPK